MIEKPFGRDYDSAVDLNNHLLKYLDDEQIFAVDYYLGKKIYFRYILVSGLQILFLNLYGVQNVLTMCR